MLASVFWLQKCLDSTPSVQVFEQIQPVTEGLTEDQILFSDRKHHSGLIVAVLPKA